MRRTQKTCSIFYYSPLESLLSHLLELFHEITSQVRGNWKPFGGSQTILVGDWLQLKPVADNFDDGRLMYRSHLFHCLFPHTIKLAVVHQQNEREARYRNILRQLRIGRCDTETVQDISHLKRELNDGHGAIHLYFTNLLVDARHRCRCYCNFSVIIDIHVDFLIINRDNLLSGKKLLEALTKTTFVVVVDDI